MDNVVRDNRMARHILDCGIELFSRRGYAATSMREIAEAAGVTKPMLYYYFDSKEGLCRAGMDRLNHDMNTGIRAEVDNQPNVIGKLVTLITTHFRFCKEHRDYLRMAGAVFLGPTEEAGNIDFAKYVREGRQIFIDAAQAACDAGLIPQKRQHLFERALAGLASAWNFSLNMDANTELSNDDAQESVICLLRGFAPDTAQQT